MLGVKIGLFCDSLVRCFLGSLVMWVIVGRCMMWILVFGKV